MTIALKDLQQLKSNILLFVFNSGHLLSLDYSADNLMVHMPFSTDGKGGDTMNGISLAFDVEEETKINSEESPCQLQPSVTVFKYISVTFLKFLRPDLHFRCTFNKYMQVYPAVVRALKSNDTSRVKHLESMISKSSYGNYVNKLDLKAK